MQGLSPALEKSMMYQWSRCFKCTMVVPANALIEQWRRRASSRHVTLHVTGTAATPSPSQEGLKDGIGSTYVDWWASRCPDLLLKVGLQQAQQQACL